MQDFNLQLDEFNFHDSYIDLVSMSGEGVLSLHIHYYNWEGNREATDQWVTKTMIITVEHCLHFQFNNSGLTGSTADGNEILDQRALGYHDQILKEHMANAEDPTEFFNTVSYRLLTNSYGEGIASETTGFLEFSGLNVKIEWGAEPTVQHPIHITP